MWVDWPVFRGGLEAETFMLASDVLEGKMLPFGGGCAHSRQLFLT